MERIALFLADLVILTALAAVALIGYVAFHPPTQFDQEYCHLVYGDGFDYTHCIIKHTI